jgi:hypothetical protein
MPQSEGWDAARCGQVRLSIEGGTAAALLIDNLLFEVGEGCDISLRALRDLLNDPRVAPLLDANRTKVITARRTRAK